MMCIGKTILGVSRPANSHYHDAIIGPNGILTLSVVMKAISNLRTALIHQLEISYRSVALAQKKVLEAKYELLVVRQQIAIIQAESAYMKDIGKYMTNEQLEEMI